MFNSILLVNEELKLVTEEIFKLVRLVSVLGET